MEKNNSNPYPIRLGELKDELQKIAFENDRSISYIIRKACKEFIEKYNKAKK